MRGLSFKIKLCHVMRHVEQLLRLCEDWNRWVVYFQTREETKKIEFLPLDTETSTKNSKGSKSDLKNFLIVVFVK